MVMPKLSKSESGKLGAIKTNILIQLTKEERIKKYNINPSTCKECNATLEYAKRKYLFCCNACSASHNNKLRIKKTNNWVCRNCQKEHSSIKGKTGIYCNTVCQQEYQYKNYIAEWLSGNQSGSIGKLNVLSNHNIPLTVLALNLEQISSL
jgi:ribosomal protein L37AE/L43A